MDVALDEPQQERAVALGQRRPGRHARSRPDERGAGRRAHRGPRRRAERLRRALAERYASLAKCADRAWAARRARSVGGRVPSGSTRRSNEAMKATRPGFDVSRESCVAWSRYAPIRPRRARSDRSSPAMTEIPRGVVEVDDRC
jgi:hypothetical protein